MQVIIICRNIFYKDLQLTTKIKCTVYPANVNNGTADGVTMDCRTNGVGEVRDVINTFIYLFIWSLGKDALMKFICIVSDNWVH